MKHQRVLGIDLGTKTGHALTKEGILLQSGVDNFTANSNGEKFLKARRCFEAMLDTIAPDVVAVERVRRFMSSAAALVFNGLLAQLLVACTERNIPVYEYSPTEIKKFATGSGTASKWQMQIAFLDTTHLKPSDDNEADAFFAALTHTEKTKS